MAKLKINTAVLSAKQDYQLDSGSITPNTHGTKKFFPITVTATAGSNILSNIVLNNNLIIDDLGGIGYKEEYGHGKNTVLHFGINSSNITVTPFSQGVVSVLGEYPTLAPPRVVQQSGSIPASSTTREQIASSVVHHTLEKVILYDAVNGLLDEDQTKTVLVDIFAREKGGLKLLPNGNIEVHTVVLYKQSANVIGNAVGKHKISINRP